MTEVRIPVQGKDVNAVLVFDTDDVETTNISTLKHAREEQIEYAIHRSFSGYTTLKLDLDFKFGKGPRFEEVPTVNIPHYAQVFSQFSQKDQDEDGGRKSFTGTGKLLVLCNCGKNTGWLDAYEEMDQAAAFLEEHHDRPVEIDLAKVTWHLGELAGYRINTDRREPYLEHACGWERELSYADMDLTQIVLLTARNKHVCQKKDQGTESG